MFTNKKEILYTRTVWRGKNHRDTFWIHKKDTLMWTQRCLKTGKKDVVKKFLLPSH